MNRIPEDTIEQILAATDIVELISGYFPVRRVGSSFKALCPFHNEKTPSFHINPGRQTFHCFGCGAGGTAIRFLMDYENLAFRTALQKLADRANIPLTDTKDLDPESRKRLARRSRIISCLADATRFFQACLADPKAGSIARDYLEKRRVTQATIEQWQLGFAPNSKNELINWAKQHKYSARDIIDAGLASLSDENNPKAGIYPRFRNRLMFPIHNDYGDVVGFSGRILDPNSKLAKYINSPETPVFDKGKLLYGLYRAKRPILKAGAALLCEGQMDLISCASNGIEHIVAPLGTALTPDHVRLLRRHTEVVVLCYDGDAAGHKASMRSFHELARAGLIVRIAPLPDGQDPDSFIQQHGRDAFLKLIDKSRDFFDNLLASRATEYHQGDLASRTRFAREVAAAIASVSDPISREHVWMRVATRLEIAPDILKREVEKQIHALNQQQHRASHIQTNRSEEDASTESPEDQNQDHPLYKAVVQLAAAALGNEEAHAILLAAPTDTWQDAPHADLLDAIRQRPCKANDNAGSQAFLSTLPDSLERTLHVALNQPLTNPQQHATDCLETIRKHLAKAKLQATHAKLRNARDEKEILDLIRRLREVQPPPLQDPAATDPF